MPLGKEVGLGPGHIVLDGDPVGTQPSHSSPSPLFGPCLLWPNGRSSQQLLSSCRFNPPKLQVFYFSVKLASTFWRRVFSIKIIWLFSRMPRAYIRFRHQILGNSFYWKLSSILPPKSDSLYNLRKKHHDRELLHKNTQLFHCNFIVRLLYKDCY